MQIKSIAVIGAGFMGAGIAQLAAQKGYNVRLIDISPDRLQQAIGSAQHFIEKLVAKRVLQEPAEVVVNRIQTSTDLGTAAEAEVVLEAIPERLADKQQLYRTLDCLCPPATLFGSNTSTIPIRLLAESTARVDRFVGTHFFFPVPLNPLLELIPTDATAPDVLQIFTDLGGRLGKHTIVVKKDVPGFIMNRLFGAMTCEAVRLVEQGVGTVTDIDHGLTTGFGMLQGPLAKADMAGLDVCLLAFQNIHDMDGSIDPPDLLRRLVAEGKLGRKTGEGFYRYDAHGRLIGPAF